MTAPTQTLAPTGDRLLAAPDASLAAHLDAFGPLPAPRTARELVPMLERSGLAGRGGAGFPTWRKLAAVPSGSGRPIVIGNGSEGEELSMKDLMLLTRTPHLVIDGLLAAAAALGADETHLHVRPEARDAVRAAARERGDASGVIVTEAPRRLVAGEASAVVSAIAGGPAVPRDRVVRLTTIGLRRRPTLVLNVETLAHLALLTRFGSEWFTSTGSHDDPGTRLVTVSGDVARPGVVEIPGGTPLRDVLHRAGAGVPRALLVGGYHGRWVSGRDTHLPFSPAGLSAAGATPGAGIIHVIGVFRCPLGETARIVRHLAGESAGQCGPCVLGLPALAATVESMVAGDRRAVPERSMALVEGRGACHHPDESVRMLRSALTLFADDVAAHVDGRCVARGMRP